MGQKLRGFVAQGMNGRKSFRDAIMTVVAASDSATPGSGTVTAPRPCTALIYLWGPGGSAGGGNSFGGGGGAAVFKRVRLAQGQAISWTCGVPGAAEPAGNGHDATDTVATLPSGVVLTAGGGKKGTGAVAGAGGTATGGDVNRDGGAGGVTATAGSSAGTGGGAGGATSGGDGGGGGGGGFGDTSSSWTGGAGSAGAGGLTGGTFGGGSGGNSGGTTGAGGPGRVLIILLRAA